MFSAFVFQGYAFGDGDHDDVLPLVLRALDAEAFPRDAHVADQTGGVTIRSAFVALTALSARALGLEAGVALLHALTLAGAALGVFLIARTLGQRPAAGALGAALACGPLAAWTLGGNALVYAHFVPESLAWPLLLPAVALVLCGNAAPAGALAGVAAWFHPLAGLLTALALGLALLLNVARRDPLRTWREEAGASALRAFSFAGAFVLVALPVLGPVLWAQRAEQAAVLPFGLTGFEVYSQLRFPHHHLPTAFSLGSWTRTGLVLLGGFAAGAWLARHMPSGALRQAAVLAGVAVALCVVLGAGSVGAASLTLARVQVFRLTVLLNVLACVTLAGAAAHVATRLAPERLRRRSLPRAAVWAGAAALLVASAAMLATRSARPPGLASLAEAEAWARDNLPPEALVAVPPGNTTFRVRARRSVVATWKAVPFRIDALAGWIRRLDALAPGVLRSALPPPSGRGTSRVPRGVPGLAERLDAAYAARDADGWARLALATGATAALVPLPAPSGLPVLFRADSPAEAPRADLNPGSLGERGWAIVALGAPSTSTAAATETPLDTLPPTP